MKKKLLLFSAALFGFTSIQANTGDTDPGNGCGKKDELNGIVIHAETKKPIRDVSVTAILIKKKEKIVATNNTGSYAFDELKPGTYNFIFEKSGYKKITKEKVVIKTDEAFRMNIEMIEASDFEIIPSPFGVGGF